jgi:hypothetical protein
MTKVLKMVPYYDIGIKVEMKKKNKDQNTADIRETCYNFYNTYWRI